MKSVINKVLEEAYVKSKSLEYNAEDWMTEEWQSIKKYDAIKDKYSGIPIDRLKDLG
jgi:hypothetical protein